MSTKRTMSSKKKVQKESTLIKCLKFPFRILILAKDLYIESMTGAGGNLTYRNTMGCPTPVIPSMARSASTTSNRDEDLIRAASLRRVSDAELIRSKSTPTGGVGGAVAKPVIRSRTVAIGRIDEDKVFEYGGDDVGFFRPDVYPRSRSKGMSKISSSKKV